jgi:ribose transport system substrate-binding protein
MRHDILQNPTKQKRDGNMKQYQKLIGAVLVLAGGFSTGARADGETIAVFTKNQTNPFFQTVRVGADAAAKSLGAKTLHYIPTKPDSIPEQLSQLEDVIVKKPNAIVFTPVDYKALVPGIEKVNEAAIPIVNITDRSSGGTFLAFVGADDYSLGLETARHLLKTLGGKGNFVIIEGVKGALTNVDRVRGFNDALKENPGAKLLASQPGNYQRLQALQVMENLMQSNAQIDGVLAANDAMAVGAIEALDGANRKALVIGINGTKEAIDAVKSGKLLATGDYNGFVQGCVGTMIAIRALRGQPVITQIVLKPTTITKDNYQPFDVPLESRVCPSWDEAAKLGAK